MNWMGGARSRIRQKDEKRKQGQFFARMRLEKQLNGQAPNAFTPASIFFQSRENALHPKPINTTLNENRLMPSSSQSKPSSIIFSSSSGFPNQGYDHTSNKHQSYKPNRKNRLTAVSVPPIYNAPISNLDQWCQEINNHKDKKNRKNTLQTQPHKYGSHEEFENRQFLAEDFQINRSKPIVFGEDSPLFFKTNTTSTSETKIRRNLFEDPQTSQRTKSYTSPKSEHPVDRENSDFYSSKSSDSEIDTVSVHEEEPTEPQRSRFSYNCHESDSFSYLTPSSSTSSKCTLPGIMGYEENVFTSPVAFNFETNKNDHFKSFSTPLKPVSTPLKGATPSLKHVFTPLQRTAISRIGRSTPLQGGSAPRNRPCTPLQGESTPLQGGSTPLQGGSTPRNRPSTPRNRPSSPRNRPSTPRNRPSTPRNRPSTPRNRPSSPRNRPSTPRNRPSTPRNRPSTPRNRPSTNYKPINNLGKHVSTSVEMVESSERENTVPENKSTKLSSDITQYKETETLKEVNFFPLEQYRKWLWKEILDQLLFHARNSPKPSNSEMNESVTKIPLPESSLSAIISNTKEHTQTREVEVQTSQSETEIPVIVDRGIQVDSEELRFNFLLTQKLWYTV